jgi:cell division protein FtsL
VGGGLNRESGAPAERHAGREEKVNNMATLPTTYGNLQLRREASTPAIAQTRVRAQQRPYELRPLPFEDVFLYSKKIDNSRLVRQADPKTGRACWTAVGAAAVLVAMLTGTLAPVAATKMAGYRLEELRAEERRLVEERRVLAIEEAALLDPARMERLAQDQKLAPPAPGQTVHLDSPTGDRVAMVK